MVRTTLLEMSLLRGVGTDFTAKDIMTETDLHFSARHFMTPKRLSGLCTLKEVLYSTSPSSIPGKDDSTLGARISS